MRAPERKSLVQLRMGDCRWPIGDPRHPDFHFCGKPKIPSLPYCEPHLRLAYQPPTVARLLDRATRWLADAA